MSDNRCAVPVCTNEVRKDGLCWGHYKRRQKGQEVHEPLATQEPPLTPWQRLLEAALTYAEAADEEAYRQASQRLRRTAKEYAASAPRPRRRRG